FPGDVGELFRRVDGLVRARHGRVVGFFQTADKLMHVNHAVVLGHGDVGGDAGEDRVGAGTVVGGAQILVLGRVFAEEVVEEDGVAAAVAALAGPQLDLVGLAEVG